jgi:hypothetical protein
MDPVPEAGRPRAWLALLLAAAAGCATVESETRPAGIENGVPRVNHPQRAWQLSEGERVLGFVVEFVDASHPEDPTRQSFSVRNVRHQEFGTVDGLGRVWSLELHDPEPRLLGSGTLAEGARRILNAGPSAALLEVPLDALRGGGRDSD